MSNGRLDPCDPVWSVVPSPNVGTGENFLFGVAVVSANDVWAVGYYGTNQTLVEHWNGTSWSVVPSPNVGTNPTIPYGVAVVSANDVWAVGYYTNGGVNRTLVEHYATLCGTPTNTSTPTFTRTLTPTPTYTRTSTSTFTPTPTPTNINAFSHLEPAGPLTVNVGSKFTLDLKVNSGFNNIINQQSYMTFTNSILQVVNATQPGCVLTNTITRDTDTFDGVFQNQVCNGNAPCNFGVTIAPPGSIAYSSGSISNPAAQGDFRVGQIAFCASIQGDALIHWQFSPPAPSERDSEVIDENSNLVSNPTLYTDYIVHVVAPTSTPAVINLVGHVTWAGQTQPNALQQRFITLTLCSTSGGSTSTYTSTTDASGFFTANVASLIPGAYNWRDKGRNSLANGGTLTLTGSDQQVEMGAQKGGDSDGSNVVSSQDFTILKNTFQTTTDPRADFNNDGVVNGQDFTILKNNFSLAGVPATCP